MALLTFCRAVCSLCQATLPQNRAPTSPSMRLHEKHCERFGNSLR